MFKCFFGLAFALLLGASAHAQDFGLTFGLSGSKASAKNSGVSSGDTEFGFRLGGVAAFPLSDQLKFRTGVLYTQRHFDLKVDGTDVKATDKFDYIDIPFLAQFNFNENFGVFGGIVAAININDSIDLSGGGGSLTGTAIGTKGLYPLIQIGVNGTFDNMYGIEAYYEMGLGDIYDGAKNYSVFGANFIYWL